MKKYTTKFSEEAKVSCGLDRTGGCKGNKNPLATASSLYHNENDYYTRWMSLSQGFREEGKNL
jgi:hypothetical protein